MVDEEPKATILVMALMSILLFESTLDAVSEGKTNIYSVDDDNTELRYYLTHLVPASRCFSRRAYALACTVPLLVF